MAKWEQGAPVGAAKWQQGRPVQRQPEQQLTRAGMAGASRGALGTLDIIPRGIAGGYNTLAGPLGLPKLDISPAQRLGAVANIGTYQPQTPGEERAAFVGEMAGATALPGGAAVRASAAPAKALTAEGIGLGGALLGGLGGEVVGGPTGQTVGTALGGLAPMAAPAVARRLVSPYGRQGMGQRLAAAQRQDVPITAGQAMGGSLLEKASATLPGGARAAGDFAEKQAGRMGGRIDDLVGGLTRTEPSSEAAGRAVKRGLTEWVENFKSRGGELYNAVDELIPAQTMTPMSNTRRALDELTVDDEAFAKILEAPLVRQLKGAMKEAGEIPYELAAQVRSRVGARLASPGMLADAPTGEIKSIYRAMSSDLDEVAKASGPQAEAAAKRASNYWRSGHKRVDDFLEPIQKRKLPEQAYKAAMAGTAEGASRLRAIRKSVTPEQWNAVTATTLRRLGKARPSERTTGGIAEEAEDFSPETFLTNLERLDVKARRALFTGTGYEGLERNLDDLQDVAQGIRAQRQQAYNPSGTASALANLGPIANAIPYANPVQIMRLLGGIGGNVLAQKAMQSPGLAGYLSAPGALVPSMAPQLTRLEAAVGE